MRLHAGTSVQTLARPGRFSLVTMNRSREAQVTAATMALAALNVRVGATTGTAALDAIMSDARPAAAGTGDAVA